MAAWYDAALQRLAVPHQSLTVPTRHGETHVITAGPQSAPAVVLLHALSANAAMWARQIPALAQDFRVCAPDVIGMTGRSAPTRLSFTDPGYAVWLRDTLDALSIAQASLIGFGFGGWLISRLAALAPGRIASAVLLNPAGFLPVRWRYLVPVIWDVLFINDEQARRLSRSMLAPPGLPLDEDAAEALYLILKHCKNQFEAPPLPERDLRRLTAPTLVMVGQHEEVWDPHALLARARRTLPDLRAAEIMPGAGHGITASHPEAVNTRILKFLKEAV